MNLDEQNFDKALKRILDNPPPMDPSKEVLEEMFERLEAHAPSAWGTLWMWPRPLWLSVALLPFLLGFAYLFNQLSLSQQKIHELELQLLSSTTVFDTLTHQQVVYRYDTIVQVRYIENRLLATTYGGNHSSRVQLPVYPTLGSYLSHTYTPGSSPVNGSSFLYSSSYAGKAFHHAGSLEETPESNRLIGGYPISSLLPQLSAPLTAPKGVSEEIEVPSLLLKKASVPVGYQLRFLHPSEVEVRAQLQRASILPEEQAGLGGVLSARIGYGKKVGLVGGVEFTRWNFEEKEAEKVASYPPGIPRNEEDRLKELYVSLSLLEVPLGIQYRILPQSTWRPYVGVEALFRKAISQNLGYEYISNFEEYRVNTPLDSTPFSFGGLRFSGGVQYPMTSNWNLHGGIWYAGDLQETSETLIPMDRWGAQVGVSYVVK